MKHKKTIVKRSGNIVVFPGTIEKLIQQGLSYVQQEKYDLAIEMFEQALVYEPNNLEVLSSYAVSLYETKKFEKAKEVAMQLLMHDETNYMNAMELYLSISIQLQEYEEVDTTISALLEEKLIPHELVKKFTYLRALNARLWRRYPEEVEEREAVYFSLEEFEALSVFEQQELLAALENEDLAGMVPTIVEIVRSGKFIPLIETFALVLLYQANYNESIAVKKFGFQRDVVPSELALPNQDEQTKAILNEFEQKYEKDPTRLDMARNLIYKYGIITYPFAWGSYSIEEVVLGYEQYIESMLTGKRIPKTELNLFIQRIDNDKYL